MHKAVVFYFSGTGNTWWVANQIKKQLDAAGINADTVSIESIDAKKADWWIKASDLVFFGWPIYGSDLPEPMKNFIDGLLPIEKGKHIHTFCTQMIFSGDGAWLYQKNFDQKGLFIDSCAHFLMPSNVSVWHGRLGPPKSEQKTMKIMDKCAQSVAQYVRDLLSGNARIVGKHSYLLGIIQRGPYRLFYTHMQDMFGVDKDCCTKCGVCAKLCPSGNIKINDYPEFAGNCALCFRCYSYCPESAITYRNKMHNVKKHGKPYRLKEPRFNPIDLK